MSQQQDIVYHLHNIGSLEPKEAWSKYGIYRLASRINDLRNQGYKITTIMVDNGKHRFAKYVLENV